MFDAHLAHLLLLVISGMGGHEPTAEANGVDEDVLARLTRLTLQYVPPPDPALSDALDSLQPSPWTLNTYASASFGDSGKGEQYAAHVGFSYALDDDVSLGIDFFGGYVRSGIDDNGGVVGLDIVYRHHFLKSEDERKTLFFNAGGGLQQASTNFSGERHFNFRGLIGFGATFQLDGQARLMLGGNYLHISDAGIKGGRGGFDGAMLYAGLTFPF
ncbi:MAG: acyloxyacyl hydrolase [Planctomycetota bacterium]|nr:acyloxyacyl hydrolase [Planctomycetota bacterium]